MGHLHGRRKFQNVEVLLVKIFAQLCKTLILLLSQKHTLLIKDSTPKLTKVNRGYIFLCKTKTDEENRESNAGFDIKLKFSNKL